MSIKRSPLIGDLAKGKWVAVDSPLRYGFAGPIGEVIQVNPASVYVRMSRQRGRAVELFYISKVSFVCDTEAEAQRLFDASIDFAKRAMRHERRLTERLQRASAKQIELLLNTRPDPG